MSRTTCGDDERGWGVAQTATPPLAVWFDEFLGRDHLRFQESSPLKFESLLMEISSRFFRQLSRRYRCQFPDPRFLAYIYDG